MLLRFHMLYSPQGIRTTLYTNPVNVTKNLLSILRRGVRTADYTNPVNMAKIPHAVSSAGYKNHSLHKPCECD